MSTTKPEALRLAAGLESIFISEEVHATKAQAIAAELRRLHQSEREGWRHASELEQERKRLHAENADLRAQLVAIGAGYTAADMATAAAQGFRDGVASVAPLMGAAGDAGWVMVPKEPTLAMGWAYLDAARESEPLRTHLFNHDGYRAMIAAAPSSAKGVAL